MNGLRYAHVLSRIVNRPLLIHPRNAAVIYNVVAGRAGLDAVDLTDFAGDSAPRASRFEGQRPKGEGDSWNAVEPFQLSGKTGIVTVTGELVNRGAWVGANSGLTSYEGIKWQIERAAKSSKTDSLLLDVESPGGEAIGALELGRFVARVNQDKPVYAVVNGMAASAAYAMVSGAKRIITGPTGLAGSIGVVLLHLNREEQYAKAGIKPTLIFAGAHKVDGNPFAALSDDVEAELQKEIDAFYHLFIDTVAEGRGRRLSAKAARDTQARTFLGAAAVEAGVADAIGTFDDVLAELKTKSNRAAATRSNRSASAMSALTDNDSDVDARIQQAREEARTQALAEARAEAAAGAAAAAEASTVGAAAERQRMAALQADPRCKGKLAFALKMATKFPSASADDIAEMCDDVPAEGATGAAGLAQQVQGTGVDRVTGGTRPTAQPGQDDDRQIAAGWDSAVQSANRRFSTVAHADRTTAPGVGKAFDTRH